MCGIAGLVADDAPGRVEAACRRMTRAQAHRGPDDEGVWMQTCEPSGLVVALGSRRLAILDPSPAGHQPMGNEDGSVWIAYNGELYNFLELRKELVGRGWRFTSRTDTEVVLRAYEAFGDDCLRRLRGMFALAIWDSRRRRLLLARDRFGEKPLYVARRGSDLLFASEVRALLASGLVERRINLAGVAGYLSFGAVPAPLTTIEGISQLPPGSVMAWESGKTEVRRYWRCTFEPARSMSQADAVEGVRAHLRDAVKSRLLSDVPLGAFLSGGTDSSAVVALMREAGVAHVRTFCLAFAEPGYNEAPYARLVANRFETQHTECVLSAEDVRRDLDDVLAAMDQPTIDGINTYFVSKLTRGSGTSVALSGLGGDELFGGYSSFWLVPRLLRLSRALNAIPGLRRRASSWLQVLPDGRSEKLSAFLRWEPTVASAYLSVKGLFVDGARERLWGDAGAAFDPLRYLSELIGSEPEALFNQVSRLELQAYLHHQLVRDADMMSMAHALEVRVPFLDHLLVEFIGRVPARLKGGAPKQLLIQALEGIVPAEVLTRPKRGFSFPLEPWMRGPWRAEMETRLLDGGSRLFDAKEVEAVWRRFLAGRVRWSRVWALIVLQDWMGRHLHGESVSVDDEGAAVRPAVANQEAGP